MHTKFLSFILACLPGMQSAHKPQYETVNGSWAHKTLASMTLREKIGQLFMVPVASCLDQPEEALASAMRKCPYNMDPVYIERLVKDYHVGGLIFLFKSTPSLQIDAVNKYQKMSKRPLLIGQDCEWGMSMRLYETTRFPRNMTLGALPDKEVIYKLGKEIGRQCKLLGVHINFAPVVDVNNNRHNPVIHDRSFGEEAQAVAAAGLYMMRGLQDAGVLACAKHFPGHGDTAVDSHLDLPVILHNRKRLMSVECVPFKKLIESGICAVMNAHLAIPALEKEKNRASSLSRAITTQLLEKDLGFTGLKITDGIGMEALTKHYAAGQIEYEAFLAGNDIILCPLDVPAAVALIEHALHTGTVSEAELDARVLKILKAKEWAGVHNFVPLNKNNSLAHFNSVHGAQLKKQLYSQAVTVLPERNFCALAARDASCVAVVQIGGDEGEFKKHMCKHLPCAYFYEPAVRVAPATLSKNATLSSADAESKEPRYVQRLVDSLLPYNTIVLPIFGMNKFSAQNYGISASTRELIAELQAADKKIIFVLFGTPYSASLLDAHAPIIIAYEDDPDAQRAAADVLLGRRVATGCCPVTVA